MNIVLVAGGTGGHIMPALAFGHSRKTKGDKIAYVCGSRTIERTIYKNYGISPFVLPMEGSPLGIKKWRVFIRRAIDVAKSLWVIHKTIQKENVDCIVLFGGYVSLPALIVGRLMKIPVIMQEQNAVAGKVTRLAKKLKVPIATGWAECEGIDGTYTGIPVRNFRGLSRKDGLIELGLQGKIAPDVRVVLVLGGSLGSSGLTGLVSVASSMVEFARYFFIVLGSSSDRTENNVVYLSPRWDMSPLYAVADIVICRAGGSTLAEMNRLKLPAVVVPWMESSDGHQYKNALSFSENAEIGYIWTPDMGIAELVKKIKNIEESLPRIEEVESKISNDDDEAVSALWQLILSHTLKGESGFGYKGDKLG